MASRMIAFVIALGGAAWLPVLPGPVLPGGALVAVWVLNREYPTRFLWSLAFLCGALYASVYGLVLQERMLPPALEGRDLRVSGRVVGLPDYSPDRGGTYRFNFQPSQWEASGCCAARGLRLSFRSSKPVVAGQHWQFTVRLKRPRSYANPGGFDYARWLVSNNLHASGYVRHGELLGRSGARRAHFVENLRERLAPMTQRGVLLALAVGDRSYLDDEQWTLFRETGLSHLMAISGLHIGIAAALGLVFGRGLQLLLSLRGHRLTTLGPAFALVFALIYAWLAGFSLPTQRAFVMTAVMAVALSLNRNVGRWPVLALAALCVLLWQPLASLTPGFWLSFSAVAILFLVFDRRARWLSLLRAQWMLLVGLLPFSLLFFQQFSPLSLPVNLVAVPLFSLCVVPLILLALALEGLAPGLALPVWQMVDTGLDLGLTTLSAAVEYLAHPVVHFSPTPMQWLGLGFCVAMLLLPRAVPARYLALLALLPVVAGMVHPTENPELAQGQFRLQVLDVGQGLSILIYTRDHVLLYDVGPRYGDTFNLVEAAVLPVLRAHQVSRLSTLMISHRDNDHAGAFERVFAALPVDAFLAGQQLPGSRACVAGQRWRWNSVEFRVLHPSQRPPTLSSNNQSCVLQISSGTSVVLLPGDIEAEVEQRLLPILPRDITALVAPHHGSKSSSSAAFVDMLAPRWVIFSAGYKHHFGHPAAEVLARYRPYNSQLLRTDELGMISILVGPQGVEGFTAHRQKRRFYWQ